jgi:hypothetical protein
MQLDLKQQETKLVTSTEIDGKFLLVKLRVFHESGHRRLWRKKSNSSIQNKATNLLHPQPIMDARKLSIAKLKRTFY